MCPLGRQSNYKNEEERWVRRAQSGDQAAFTKLVYQHQRFVYNLALRGVSDPHEAEDIVQEAFLRAWQALPRFQQKAKFRTWLYRIVVNLCYNRLPRLKEELAAIPVEVIEALPDDVPDNPENVMRNIERRAFLHEQIERLPDGYRLILLLRYQQGLSYQEISEVTEMPLRTVKTGLHRAHRQLRQAMQEFEEVAV
jgi:RNA polymerase sigma-70 factor (ECF subfamily)